MFSAVTHVLSQAANGAMYLVGGNNPEENAQKQELPPVAIAVEQPLETKHEAATEIPPTPSEPAPTAPAAPAAPTAPPQPQEPVVEKIEKVKREEIPKPQEKDEFDLSKWT